MTITRRHHPLVGQTLDVTWGAKGRLTVVMPDGYCAIIPREWTDAGGGVLEHDVNIGSVFTINAVRQLMALLDALRKRS